VDALHLYSLPVFPPKPPELVATADS